MRPPSDDERRLIDDIRKRRAWKKQAAIAVLAVPAVLVLDNLLDGGPLLGSSPYLLLGVMLVAAANAIVSFRASSYENRLENLLLKRFGPAGGPKPELPEDIR